MYALAMGLISGAIAAVAVEAGSTTAFIAAFVGGGLLVWKHESQ